MWILIVAFVVRAAAVLLLGILRNDKPDGVDYAHIALTLVSEHRYAEDHYFARPPLFPLLLAPFGIFGEAGVVASAKLLNVAAGVLSTWLSLLIMRPRGERAAQLAALSVALHPTLVYYTTWVTTEVLYATLVLASLLSVLRLLEAPSRRRAVITGALFACWALTRPQALAIEAALGLALIAYTRRVDLVAIAAAVAVLCISPWTVRNYLRHGEVVLIADGGGLMFQLASSDYGARLAAVESKDEYHRLERELYGVVLPSQMEKVRALGPASRDRWFFGEARAWIVDHPADFMISAARRTARFCAPWVSPYAYSAKAALISACWFVPLFFAGGAGLVTGLRRRDPLAFLALLIMWATIFTVGAFFHSVQRYRIPNVDLLLGLFAGVALGKLCRSIPRPA